MSFKLDFKEIAATTDMERVVQLLNIRISKRQGAQWRGNCPICKSDRAFGINADKKRFNCFDCKNFGDAIQLVALVKDCKPLDAAKFLSDGTVPNNPQVPTVSTVPQAPRQAGAGFDATAYAAKLDPAHSSLASLNLSAETLASFKSGYCSTGKLRGRLAVPLTDRTGKVLCYAGRTLKDEQPQLLCGADSFDPKSVLFGWDKVQAGDTLYVARDVLDVLRAYEGGATVVSFLGDVTSDALQVLSHFMDELQIASVEFV